MDLCEKKRSSQGANYRREDLLGKKEERRRAKIAKWQIWEGIKIPSRISIAIRPGISSLSPDPFLLHFRPPPRPGRRGGAPSITSTTAPQRATNTSTIALRLHPSPAPSIHRHPQRRLITSRRRPSISLLLLSLATPAAVLLPLFLTLLLLRTLTCCCHFFFEPNTASCCS